VPHKLFQPAGEYFSTIFTKTRHYSLSPRRGAGAHAIALFISPRRGGGDGVPCRAGERTAGRATAGRPGSAGRVAGDHPAGRIRRPGRRARKSRNEGPGAGFPRIAPVQGRRTGQKGTGDLYDREGAVRGHRRSEESPAGLGSGNVQQHRHPAPARNRANQNRSDAARAARPASGRPRPSEGQYPRGGSGAAGSRDRALLHRDQIADRRSELCGRLSGDDDGAGDGMPLCDGHQRRSAHRA